MTAIPFPVLSAPGRKPQSAGGRLINCFPEKLSGTAGEQYIYWRTPGLKAFGTSGGATFRGALQVGSTVYAVIDDTAYSFSSSGGAGTPLSGTVPGTAPVIMARNNAATPNIAIVSPGDGVVQIASGSVSSWPDADVGQPNSVCFLKGFFVFTYGDGKTRTSGVNSTSINTLDVATAESKPDTLYRPMPLGNGQLLLVGSASTEVWGGQVNDTGYPFSYIATIPRGVVGPYAITGDQDGWGKGIYAVGDDLKVSRLDGYQFTPISPVELDTLIEAEEDRTQISISVYVAQGRGYVVVQSPTWCWEFDTVLQSWHERQSHLLSYWRCMGPVNAFGKWLCGDRSSGNLLEISSTTHDETGDPLRMRIETGPLGGFPKVLRINGIELYLTKGVGIATGTDPVQTDPDVEISISRDGGTTWSAGRLVKAGRQSVSSIRARSAIWGQADVQGVRWRFDESSSVPYGLMGADMQADTLR
ncbi:hypothetical protein [Afipia clevelandensis]|uniref:Uncharacterized protein n=1 Tax=Afipia clevelandensis ATCC 49720 TaxID=883079 RepID=K8P8E4_9BRAD|nr:hypothetical protein [Afipia clevelandensis]EKS37761.1 hypothetical protein HMPREF9696_01711 [Afipia clevelandensis ATCC 49720]